MSARDAIARDENIRNLPRQRGGTPMGTHDRLSAEIPDIFIPPTQNGNAGVMGGRNENSGMTTGGTGGRQGAGILSPPLSRGWIVPVGDTIPDRRGGDRRGNGLLAEN